MSYPKNSLEDAVGNTILVGMYVAYITQQGGWRSIKRRRVTAIHVDKGCLTLDPLTESYSSGRSGVVLPRNCVVVA